MRNGAGRGKKNYGTPKSFSLLFVISYLLFIICYLLFISCSTAPKQPAEIFTDRTMAVNQLNLANQTASRGRYEDALLILEEARRMVVSTDDPPLRIKSSISRGSILFYLGRHAEAFNHWEIAAAEGDSSGEPVLASQARIYAIRARIVLLGSDGGGSNTNAAAEEYKASLARELAIVKTDASATAAGLVTLGLAEKHLGRYAEGESAIAEALAIHEKNLALEDAAYDWFLIASIRSVAGNHESAIEALKMSISFDRRAENGFGLASSWQAMGDVYLKAGRAEESRAAYSRAAEIFRAIGLSGQAEKLE